MEQSAGVNDRARRLLLEMMDMVSTSCSDRNETSQQGSSRIQQQNFVPLPYSSLTPTNEHNRLFGFSSKRSKGKKRQKECYSNPVQDSLCATPNLKSNSRKNVWVHDCCCLASHSQDFVPSSSQKMELASVGLGLKNLTFLKMATDEEIESVIYEAFPKLAGLGFELL